MILNPNLFVYDIPKYHPLSNDYLKFWRGMKKKCIEGDWVGGYYMPPALFSYANIGTIRLNEERSNTKSFKRPWLRDLEWGFFRHYTLARGFSGFKNDKYNSCNLDLLNLPDHLLPISCLRPDGQRKNFIPPQEYLEMYHPPEVESPPLFENQAYNVMLMGSRNTGKSYMVGVGLVMPLFLFDGVITYSEESVPSPVEIIVGANDSKFSNDLLKKTREGLDHLPGKSVFNDKHYPSPISKQFSGSWDPGKEIKAEYKKKLKGGWVVAGSKSSIKNRTFNANSFAAQGTRPLLMVLEEIGMFDNLKEVYSNTVDNFRDGSRKVGTLMMLGTGGDMESGTIDASEMFYEPEKYDILPTKDMWEHKGNIGYFIPAYLALNQFKDKETGYTKIDEAKDFLSKTREKLRLSKGSSDALHKEMQYRPVVPSEMFLMRTANIFPSAEIRRRATELKDLPDLSSVVELYFDPEAPSGVSYAMSDDVPINTYPYDKDNREGAVVIYEHPKRINGQILPESYIIGCDPYKDDSQTGQSLAAIYVLKTHRNFAQNGQSKIVASYIGRPYEGKNKVNEILYKLALYYNATIYFENAVGNVKDYFDKIKRLDLLAKSPTTVLNKKASYETLPTMSYGYPMSNDKIKWEAVQYLRSWLLEVVSETDDKIIRNVDLIEDPALLQELMVFDMKRNTDRVMALVGCVIGLEELHNRARFKNTEVEDMLEKEFEKFIVNNKNLFNATQISKTKTFL